MTKEKEYISKTNKNGDGLRYLYNWEQANFYLEQGVIPAKIGKHKRTHNIFFAFPVGEETDKAYKIWCGIQ